MLIPAVSGVVRRRAPGHVIFMLAGSVAFIGLTGVTRPAPGWATWGRTGPPLGPAARLAATCRSGIALFVVGVEARLGS